MIDVADNGLRFHAVGAFEDQTPRSGLARVIDVAARQGDARGDETRAIAVRQAGLRHPDALPAERDEALAFLAELTERTSASP